MNSGFETVVMADVGSPTRTHFHRDSHPLLKCFCLRHCFDGCWLLFFPMLCLGAKMKLTECLIIQDPPSIVIVLPATHLFARFKPVDSI